MSMTKSFVKEAAFEMLLEELSANENKKGNMSNSKLSSSFS